MERTRHKRVIINRVGEYDELGAAHRVVVLCQLGRLLDDAPHQADSIQIHARLGRRDVDRRADQIGLGQRLGNGVDEDLITLGKALLHKGGKTADKVYAGRACRAVKRLGKRHIAISVGHRADHRDRGDRNALVDDRDAQLALDLLTGRNQLLRAAGDLIIHLVRKHVDVVAGEVSQRNAHRDRADVKVLLLDHLDGFQNILCVDH